jgi:hypothetical protein
LSASPLPWKNKKLRKKSATKIVTSEMTTALVVASPTPFAPPVVVKPHAQLMVLMHKPNTHALTHETPTSKVVSARRAESRMTLAGTE